METFHRVVADYDGTNMARAFLGLEPDTPVAVAFCRESGHYSALAHEGSYPDAVALRAQQELSAHIAKEAVASWSWDTDEASATLPGNGAKPTA